MTGQNIKLEKVDDKTAYENLLVKYADLENQNRLLGERCNQLLKDKGNLTDQIADIKANCDLAIEGRDIKIKELEQENAELKETLKTYNGCGDWDNDFHTCRVYLQHEELQMYINQLTKATDLLKKFIETSNPIYFDEDRQKVKVDAEQFIKEIEK